MGFFKCSDSDLRIEDPSIDCSLPHPAVFIISHMVMKINIREITCNQHVIVENNKVTTCPFLFQLMASFQLIDNTHYVFVFSRRMKPL